jgi:heme/copper-type cytochrome/quinol oxidase subunit 2
MSVLANAANEAEHAVSLLDTMPFFIGAMVVFTLLALVTWSYRDVANRHDHKSGNSEGHH